MERNIRINMMVVALAVAFFAVSGCNGGNTDVGSDAAKKADPSDSSIAVNEAPAAETAPVAEDAKIENTPAAPEASAVSEPVIENASADGLQASAAFVGDPAKGKRVFIKCMACHGIGEGENKIGPSLYKIVGAPAGRTANFKYSDAIASSGIVWTEDVLSAYLENPAKYLHGNKMLFPGLPSPQDRADVIAYLNSVE